MRSSGARRGATAVAVFSVIAATITVASTESAAAAALCGSGVVGDVNGDGYAEVAVSSLGRSRSRGAVHLFYGGPAGLVVDAAGTSLDDQYFDQDSPGVPGIAKTGDRFGSATALGDLNGDGCADLVVGAKDDRAVGSVTVLYGSPAGVTTAGAQFFSPDGLFGGKPGDYTGFGSVVVIADLDHDGRNDLALGVPEKPVANELNPSGGVVVLYGAAAGLNRGVAPLVVDRGSAAVLAIPVTAKRFGTSLAAGDFDGNGSLELAVGWTSEGDNLQADGAVQVVEFDADGLAASQSEAITQDTPGVPGGGDNADTFAAALAAGDVDGDGTDDLAVGAPYETPTGSPTVSDGVVVLLPGSSKGLTGDGSQLWSRISPGIEGEPGAAFGSALAMGPLNSDGRDDLVIGTPRDPTGTVEEAGGAVVLFGTASGLTATGSLALHQGPDGVGGTAQPGVGFGYSVATAFLQSPTQASVVIGAPYVKIGARTSAGQIHQLSLSPAGPIATSSRVIHLSVLGVKGVAKKNGSFGYAVN
jgi:hypothetical protein